MTIRIPLINVESIKNFFTRSPKKVISIVVFMLLLVGVVFTAYNYWRESQVNILNVEVTNLTNGAATITWETNIPSKAVVTYGKDNTFSPIFPFIFKSVEYDDRFTEFTDLNVEKVREGGLGETLTHHVTIEGLDPEEVYYFRIGNGFVRSFVESSEGYVLGEIVTGPVLNQVVTPDPVYGSIIDEEGNGVPDAIVKLTLVRRDEVLSKTLSTYTNESGGFSLDVANARYLFSDIQTYDEKTVSEEDVFNDIFILEEGIRVEAGANYETKYFKIDPDQDQPTNNLVIKKFTFEEGELKEDEANTNKKTGSLIFGVNAQAMCDGWAADQSVQDNTDNCRKYKCNNGTWEEIGEATHPDCGGGGGDGGSSDGGGDGGSGDGGASEDANCESPVCGTLSSCRQRCNGYYQDVGLSACAGLSCNPDGEGSPCESASCCGYAYQCEAQECAKCNADPNRPECKDGTNSAGNKCDDDEFDNGDGNDGGNKESCLERCGDDKNCQLSCDGFCSSNQCRKDDGSCGSCSSVEPEEEEEVDVSGCDGSEGQSCRVGSKSGDCVRSGYDDNGDDVYACVTGSGSLYESCVEEKGCRQKTGTAKTECFDECNGIVRIPEEEPDEPGFCEDCRVGSCTSGSRCSVCSKCKVEEESDPEFCEDCRVGSCTSGNRCSVCSKCDVEQEEEQEEEEEGGDDTPSSWSACTTGSGAACWTPDQSLGSCASESAGDAYCRKEESQPSRSCTAYGSCVSGGKLGECVNDGNSWSCDTSGTDQPYAGGAGVPTDPDIPKNSCEGLSDGDYCVGGEILGGYGICKHATGGSIYCSNPDIFHEPRTCGSGKSPGDPCIYVDSNGKDKQGICRYSGPGEGECVSGSSSKINRIENSIFSSKLGFLSNAQSSSDFNVDEGVLEVSESGYYLVESDSFSISGGAPIRVLRDSEEFRFFTDTNSNGVLDEGEEYLTNLGEISIEKVADIHVLNINEGWNLVSFPGLLDSETVGEVMAEMIDQGLIVTHMAKYEKGQFGVATYRSDIDEGEVYGNNFALIPGQAYFVKSANKKTIGLNAKEILDPVPLQLETGWNLIGIISPNKAYTAESVLDSMQSQDIPADILSRYNSGIYQNVIKEDGVLYGNDFNILETEGYFLRVQEGGKTWTP